MTDNNVMWLEENDPADHFPPIDSALREPDGLLAAGGDLSMERLLYAYRNGIFPWYSDGQPLLWWSPDPRCIFMPGDYRISRRLRRELRNCSIEIRVNTSFCAVVQACAEPRRAQQGTWITTEMIEAYNTLHHRGWAHSIEVWQSGKLSGGLYGLAIGKIFFGESMFSIAPNASKLALLYLATRLEAGDLQLLDCQLSSRHLLSLGARIVPRDEFLRRLDIGCYPVRPFSDWPDAHKKCSELLSA